jgi:hypothetical protein
MAAAVASGRNSVGVELERGLMKTVRESVKEAVLIGRQRVVARLAAHREFAASRNAAGKEVKHHHATFGFPVVTAQERDLLFYAPERLKEVVRGRFEVEHQIVPAAVVG